MARHFRERYADIPRILGKSSSPEAALIGISALLGDPSNAVPIEQTLLANAINGLA